MIACCAEVYQYKGLEARLQAPCSLPILPIAIVSQQLHCYVMMQSIGQPACLGGCVEIWSNALRQLFADAGSSTSTGISGES